jgi:VanZ family protein
VTRREPLLRLLFWAAALFAFVMALVPRPPPVPGHPSDKLLHVLAFATLGLLGGVAYRRVGALKLIGGLSLFGAVIEILQGTALIHRDRDVLDWVADTIACAVVVLALRAWQARER